MGPLARHRYLITGIVAVLVLVTIAGATAHFREGIMVVERRMLEALAPIQRAATETGRSIRLFWESLMELRHLREENARLAAELERLAAETPRLAEAEQEIRQLREMLDFLPPAEYETVAAQIIGRSLGNWFGTVEINRGERHGVALNSPVVTQLGLVGKVVRVTQTTATVMLLVDPQSGAGAQIVRSREPGVVIGNASFGENCTMRLFSRDADVVSGDIVLTSGLGDIYPGGLYIGAVSEVRRVEQGLVVLAEVAPAVDFSRLANVFVLLPRGPLEEGIGD